MHPEFLPHRWYWILCELLIKLLLTGVLGFIAPGTVGQVVAGLFLSLGYYLVLERLRPYELKSYGHISAVCALIVHVFMIFVLLVKGGIYTMSSDAHFKDTCVSLLLCLIFSLPGLIILRRLRWKLGEQHSGGVHHDVTHEGDEGEDDDEDRDAEGMAYELRTSSRVSAATPPGLEGGQDAPAQAAAA